MELLRRAPVKSSLPTYRNKTVSFFPAGCPSCRPTNSDKVPNMYLNATTHEEIVSKTSSGSFGIIPVALMYFHDTWILEVILVFLGDAA